jgi:hypothetical protein
VPINLICNWQWKRNLISKTVRNVSAGIPNSSNRLIGGMFEAQYWTSAMMPISRWDRIKNKSLVTKHVHLIKLNLLALLVIGSDLTEIALTAGQHRA